MIARRNWTTEELKHYLATGQEPIDSAPGPTVPRLVPGTVEGPANKYGARKSWRDGIRFDSEVEAARYEALKADREVSWIDVHPVLTLPGNIRYRADFLVHYRDGLRVVEDVKGMRPKSDFWRLKKLFDATHPLTPLVVIRWRKGEWIRVLSPRGWPPRSRAPCAPEIAEATL